MKKFTKTILITSLLLFLTGAGCMIAGCVMGITSGDFIKALKQLPFVDLESMMIFTEEGSVQIPWSENGENIIDNTWSYQKDEVRKMMLELSASNCNMYLSDDEQIRISSTKVSDVNVELRNGTLVIETDAGAFKENNGRIDIYVPFDMKFEVFELSTGAGNIVIDCPIQADVFEVEAGASAVFMNQMITAREFDIELGAGMADIRLLDAMDIKINNGAGQTNIGLSGQQERYRVTVESAAGDVRYGEETFSGIANTYRDNPKDADRIIEIESALGEVNITFEEVI